MEDKGFIYGKPKWTAEGETDKDGMLRNMAMMVEKCDVLAKRNAFVISTQLEMRNNEVTGALDALDEISHMLETAEAEYRLLLEDERYPSVNSRGKHTIGFLHDLLYSWNNSEGDMWEEVLQNLLADSAPGLRSNLRVKNTALRFLSALLDSREIVFYDSENLPLIEAVVSYQVLLAYAYGNEFLSGNDIQGKGGVTLGKVIRARPHQSAEVQDEVAKQVVKWWTDQPREAFRLREHATALLVSYCSLEKSCAEYVCQIHVEKGIKIPFPRLLLHRMKREYFPLAVAERKAIHEMHSKSHSVQKNLANLAFDLFQKHLSKSDGYEAPIPDTSRPPLRMYAFFKTHLRHSIQLLVSISAHVNIVRPVLQENGLRLIMSIFKLDKTDDLEVVCDTMLLAAHLCKQSKFANEFLSLGCLNLLCYFVSGAKNSRSTAQPTPSPRAPSQPRKLHCFAYVLKHLAPVGIVKMCRMPSSFLRQVNKLMIALLNHQHDLTCENAAAYWSEAVKCPIMLRMFDNLGGVNKTLDGLSYPARQQTTMSRVEGLVGRFTHLLATYMRVHVAIAAHRVQNEIALRKRIHSKQLQHQERQSRPRSDSLTSFSSYGSSSSARFRTLADDQPLEVDPLAHEAAVNVLQTNRDVAMKILFSSKWKPVEAVFSYSIPAGLNQPSPSATGASSAPVAARIGSESTTGAADRAGTPDGDGNFGATPTLRALAAAASYAPTSRDSFLSLVSDGDQRIAVIMLLQIIRFTLALEMPRVCHIQASTNALDILRMLTLLPHAYKLVCEAIVPVGHSPFDGIAAAAWWWSPNSDEELYQGITILLETATPVLRDAQLITSALQVICNCCTPSMGDDRAQRPVRRLARNNNAIMALLALLRYDETPRQADMIRYLACLALHGLANDHHVAQVLETLNTTQALTRIARSEPVLVENKRIHKRLKREALKLIEQISDACKYSDSKAIIGDVADATNKRLMRNAIVEKTQISFDSRELLQLIQDHLKDHGFQRAAETLREETAELYGGAGTGGGATLQDLPPRFEWPAKYLTQQVRAAGERRKFGFISAQSDKGQSILHSRSSSLPPPHRPTHGHRKRAIQRHIESPGLGKSPGFKRRRVAASDKAASSASVAVGTGPKLERGQRILHSSAGNSTGLEKIVQDYLREQHRKCLDPVTIVPPFSLLAFRDHQCKADSRRRKRTGGSANMLKRLVDRELYGTRAKHCGDAVHDVRFVHGRQRVARTFRNITRNDEIIINQNDDTAHDMSDESELNDIVTSVAFLHHTSNYEDLLLGTSRGDLVIRNTHTCQTFAKWNIHPLPIRSVAVTSCGTRVLTCASDNGEVALSRLPTSIVQEYSPGATPERAYSFSTLRRNRPEDVLDRLWTAENIADVELDSAGSHLVATLLNPEQDGHEHAAVVYDLASGQAVSKLVDNKLSSRYWWHRACFAPDGSNTVLHDGLLWDVRSRKIIHKFDKLSECGRCTFKPDNTQVVIDASVWDMRTFKLFAMCPVFEAAVVTFDAKSSVAYSYRPDLQITAKSEDEKYYSTFSSTDVSDYSTITSDEIYPFQIQGLALNESASRLAVITQRSTEDERMEGSNCSVKLYDIGRQRKLDKNAGGNESEDEEDDDGMEDSDDDDMDDSASGSDSERSAVQIEDWEDWTGYDDDAY